MDTTPRRTLEWCAILTIALLIGLNVYKPVSQAAILGLLVLMLTISLSRLRLEYLFVTYIVGSAASQFLKRAMFLWLPSRTLYYGIQFAPYLIFFVIMVVTFSSHTERRRSPATKYLLGLCIMTVVTTLISASRNGTWFSGIAALLRYASIYLMFFTGRVYPVKRLPLLMKTFTILAVLSVIYGGVQFFGGPTLIDRVWAVHTAGYSLQGRKLYAYMAGSAYGFNGYAFFEDALNWGLFLVISFTAARYLRVWGAHTRKMTALLMVFIFMGLFFTTSRTPWFGVLTIAGCYYLLKKRLLQKPWQFFLLSLFVFPLIVGLSRYLIDNFALLVPRMSSYALSRYSSIGTLNARLADVDSMLAVLRQNWLLGQGFVFDPLHAYQRLSSIDVMVEHVFIASLIYHLGLAGLLLFWAFYVVVIQQTLVALQAARTSQMNKKLGFWCLSFLFASVLMGYSCGINFLTPMFFFIAGILPGLAETPLEPPSAPKAVQRTNEPVEV